MLQIIGLLLCIYLIFKGVEIFQIAYVSEREWSEMPMLLGIAALLASIGIAVLFAWWLLVAGTLSSDSLNRLP